MVQDAPYGAPVAFNFTYDIATDLGRVRLRLTDTNHDTAVFRDEEILDVLERCGGDIDCATLRLLRILKAHAAIRGEADRAVAIDNVIQLLPNTALETGMPLMPDSVYPAPWPMDDAFEEPQQ